MASDPSIYNLVGQGVTPLMSPAEIQGRKNALALQSQQIQQNALALEQTQRQMASQANLSAFLRDRTGTAPVASPQLFDTTPAAAPPSSAGSPDSSGLSLVQPGPASLAAAPAPAASAAAAPPALPVPPRPTLPTMDDLVRAGVLPSDASGLIQQFQKIDETAATIDKTQKEAAKAQGDLAGLVQEQGAKAAHAVIASNYNPAVINWQLQHFASMGPKFAQMAAHIAAAIQANPATAPQIFNSIAEAGTAQREAGAAETTANEKRDRLIAELPGIQAENALKTLKAEGKEPIQPAQKEQLDKLTDEAELAHKAAAGDPVAKKALDLLARTRQASQPQINITPEGYGVLAQQYQTTGQLPTFNRGPGGQVQANIINGMGAANPGFNPGATKADYKANADSLASLQKQRDAVVTFEKNARANLDNFVSLAGKLPDTGVPWLNQPLRNINDKAVGNEWAPAIAAARQIAVNEIAKVTSNPTLSGALSDSARHEVAEYNPANATYKQTLNVAKVLRQDMANRRQFLDEGIQEIRGRLGAGGGLAAPHDVPQVGASFNGQKVLSVTRIE